MNHYLLQYLGSTKLLRLFICQLSCDWNLMTHRWNQWKILRSLISAFCCPSQVNCTRPEPRESILLDHLIRLCDTIIPCPARSTNYYIQSSILTWWKNFEYDLPGTNSCITDGRVKFNGLSRYRFWNQTCSLCDNIISRWGNCQKSSTNVTIINWLIEYWRMV